jgi:hypothetical protein
MMLLGWNVVNELVGHWAAVRILGFAPWTASSAGPLGSSDIEETSNTSQFGLSQLSTESKYLIAMSIQSMTSRQPCRLGSEQYWRLPRP